MQQFVTPSRFGEQFGVSPIYTLHVFYKIKFYKKTCVKNPKTLRKCEENLQLQMNELKLLKTLIFAITL